MCFPHVCLAQVRVDCTGFVGYTPNPSFDSLIAKIIVHSVRWSDAVRLLRRALAEIHIGGVSSNIGFLRALAATPEFETNDVTTTFVEENMLRLCDAQALVVQSCPSAPSVVEVAASHHQHHHQHQHQLPAGSISLTSPIRGRMSRLSDQLQGQIAAGACVCVAPCPSSTFYTILFTATLSVPQLRAGKHEDGVSAVCAPRLRCASVVCGGG
jgi:acetyl/propionyl-CoA carboxylase alpha subunit